MYGGYEYWLTFWMLVPPASVVLILVGTLLSLASLRVFRIPLALWNLTMVLLMVIWFPG